jgi:mannitol 2-dehydrogenase
MVDRITPAPTKESVALLKAEKGVDDPCSVVCEDFLLWVIEDNFPFGRPAWDEVAAGLGGACLVVKNVVPYELMKLRVLNGAHQAVAYVGLQAGYRFVDEAMDDEGVRSFVRSYMAAAVRTLPPIPGIDANEWADQTVGRFRNTKIKDTLLRLAEDSVNRIESAVTPQVMGEAPPAEGGIAAVGVLLAGWAKYLAADKDEKGEAYARWADKRGGEARSLAQAAVSDPKDVSKVRALLAAAVPAFAGCGASAAIEEAVSAELGKTVAESLSQFKATKGGAGSQGGAKKTGGY